MRLARLIERDVGGGVHAQIRLDVGDEQEGHHERATQRDRAAHRRRVGEVARHLAVEVQILELHRRRDAFGVRRPDAAGFPTSCVLYLCRLGIPTLSTNPTLVLNRSLASSSRRNPALDMDFRGRLLRMGYSISRRYSLRSCVARRPHPPSHFRQVLLQGKVKDAKTTAQLLHRLRDGDRPGLVARPPPRPLAVQQPGLRRARARRRRRRRLRHGDGHAHPQGLLRLRHRRRLEPVPAREARLRLKRCACG